MNTLSPLLRVANLTTELHDGDQWQRIVNDVSFQLHEGETFCLVGESGSGKSVTALSLMGLLPRGRCRHPEESAALIRQPQGECNLLRAGTAEMADIRGRAIGMVFQEPMTSLNPVMTVGEQLNEVLLLHDPMLDVAARMRRIIAALEEVHIPEAARRLREYPHRLSGGQRQRVMIAMALICSPRILIADEPTTALDVTVQADILRLMKRLQRQRGMGMLFITHDFGVVAQIADTVGVMQYGRLVEVAPVGTILTAPAHPYTRSLIAALPEHLSRPSSAPMVSEKPRTVSPLLEVRDLKVHFPVRRGLLRRVVDQFRAVDGVSLAVNAGEVLALVGESGCGKSTLGKAILRLLKPTDGEILLNGRNITHLHYAHLRPYRREMQIIFQDPGSSLNPRLPIATTLFEPMRLHGIADSDEACYQIAAELLQRVGMSPDSLWRYPHEFSGGQRQRLAIARALVLRPRFILCDEVTSALDVSVQAEILYLLRSLVDQHDLGILFITHNMGVVEYLSDRMAVMYGGKIVEAGKTAQVLGHPQEEYTRNLLASVPRLDLYRRDDASG